jgi:hypothetical protein
MLFFLYRRTISNLLSLEDNHFWKGLAEEFPVLVKAADCGPIQRQQKSLSSVEPCSYLLV